MGHFKEIYSRPEKILDAEPVRFYLSAIILTILAIAGGLWGIW